MSDATARTSKRKAAQPQTKKYTDLKKSLDTVEAQPGLQRMMKASAADIETGRVLNTRQLRQRRKQITKAKDSR